MLPVTKLLHSESGRTLDNKLSRLGPSILSDSFDLDRVKALLATAVADDADDALIWDEVRRAIIESTPRCRQIASVELRLTYTAAKLGAELCDRAEHEIQGILAGDRSDMSFFKA